MKNSTKFVLVGLLLAGWPLTGQSQQVPVQRPRLVRAAAKVGHFLGNHVTLDASAAGSSGFATYGTYRCRRSGVEPCTGHYGSALGIEISRAGLTAVAIAMSEWGRKQGLKEWAAPDVIAIGFNTFWGVRELRTRHFLEVESSPKGELGHAHKN